MVKAVQELESGKGADTVASNRGIPKATLYNWKSKYCGMEVLIRGSLQEGIKESLSSKKFGYAASLKMEAV